MGNPIIENYLLSKPSIYSSMRMLAAARLLAATEFSHELRYNRDTSEMQCSHEIHYFPSELLCELSLRNSIHFRFRFDIGSQTMKLPSEYVLGVGLPAVGFAL